MLHVSIDFFLISTLHIKIFCFSLTSINNICFHFCLIMGVIVTFRNIVFPIQRAQISNIIN